MFIGVDLAWTQTNETGVVALESNGNIRSAGWTLGHGPTSDWIESHADDDTLVFVDAPLIVTNQTRQRPCEQQVGQRYWRAKVSANSTNLSPRFGQRLGGLVLLSELERRGFRYDDGIDGPPRSGRTVSECYPYTTIVGSEFLGYDERPMYKRPPRGKRSRMPTDVFKPLRARACDDLITRIARLTAVDPPLDLRSHETTRALVDLPSPLNDGEYKHREDLLDAALAAWTAAVWWRYGTTACQVLGADRGVARPAATIIAPAKPEQRASTRAQPVFAAPPPGK
ncbi:MAG: DUF429 domain-containing protein [Chloroflexota bacterium]